MKDLLQWPGVASVRSTFALETLKLTTAVPLDVPPAEAKRRRRPRRAT